MQMKNKIYKWWRYRQKIEINNLKINRSWYLGHLRGLLLSNNQTVIKVNFTTIVAKKEGSKLFNSNTIRLYRKYKRQNLREYRRCPIDRWWNTRDSTPSQSTNPLQPLPCCRTQTSWMKTHTLHSQSNIIKIITMI